MQCTHKTKRGGRCKHPATAGQRTCAQHNPRAYANRRKKRAAAKAIAWGFRLDGPRRQ